MLDNESDVFIMRDFEIDAYVGLALEYLKKHPPDGKRIRAPGLPGAAEQGHLLENILNPEISNANYVIAFMDTPNANVGYELGYALGTSRRVALATASANVPDWLNKAPMSGYLVQVGADLAKLQRIITEEQYISVDPSRLSSEGDGTRRGSDVLFLSPRSGEGAVGHALVQDQYSRWRVPEVTGWNLEDLPQQMLNVGEVVWVITPYAPGHDRRDGQENALNAIIAGYASGAGIPLRILKSTRHRTIADVQQQAIPFTHLADLENLLLEAEDKRVIAVMNTEHRSGTKLPKPSSVTTSGRTSKWFQAGQLRGRGVGLIENNGPVATCILIAPEIVMTPSHVADFLKHETDCFVRFEMLEEMRKIKGQVWSSPVGELDVTLFELDQPVSDTDAPLRLDPASKIGTGSQAIVCGHPKGGALTFSLRDTAIISFDDRSVRYRTPTEPGSSGSAVFDEEFNLIAMHRLGLLDRGDKINEGVRTDAIAQVLASIPELAGLGISD
ncbi:MAG: serine protease [Pseudomonadota bacterium]